MSDPMPTSAGLTPLAASQLAQQDPVLAKNTEPGFANTYTKSDGPSLAHGLIAAPALGMGALSLYLLYQKKKQDERDKLEAEQLNPKLASLADVKAQLPGIHAPDILLGGAAGAGAGALYDYFKGAPKEKRYSTALKRILTGALAGAAGTNLLGDRTRRYITNSLAGPFGYDAGNILKQLKPRSLQHVIDAAIYDKPSYDPKVVAQYKDLFGGNADILQRAIGARRELNRIGMGVHASRPDADIWQRNRENNRSYYSVNERNPEYVKNLQALMLPSMLHPFAPLSYKSMQPHLPPGVTEEQYRTVARPDISPLFQDPENSIQAVNRQGDWRNTDLFGSNTLLGGQQVMTRRNGQTVEGTVLDRYDITPEQGSLYGLLSAILSGRMFSSKWRNEKQPGTDYTGGQTNAQIARSNVGRLIWDKILTREAPWVAQKFRFTPDATNEYSLQLLKQDNTPATKNYTAPGLSEHLSTVQQSTP